MSDVIKKGDIVDVYFENCPWETNVEVIYTPSAPGEYFCLKREDGTPVAVMSFVKMVRISQLF